MRTDSKGRQFATPGERKSKAITDGPAQSAATSKPSMASESPLTTGKSQEVEKKDRFALADKNRTYIAVQSGTETSAGDRSKSERKTFLESRTLLEFFAGRKTADGPSAVAQSFDRGGGVAVDVVPFKVKLDRHGRSKSFDITIPKDAVSFTINATGKDDVEYAVVDLVDPQGRKVVAHDHAVAETDPNKNKYFAGPFASPNRANSFRGSAMLMVPNTPDVAMRPGTWRARIAGLDGGTRKAASGEIEGVVYIKRAEQPPTRGKLKLHLHFSVGKQYIYSEGRRSDTLWTAKGAPNNPDLELGIQQIRDLFADVGIDVEIAGYHDVPERFRTIESLRIEGSESKALFGHGKGETLDGINVFFTHNFQGNELLDRVSGYSAAVGAPGAAPGTGSTGYHRRHKLLSGSVVKDSGTRDRSLFGPESYHREKW